MSVIQDAVATMDHAVRVIEQLKLENASMRVAIAKLVCPRCDHELQHHRGKDGCEIERGDGYRHAEFQEALGPCGCNVDELKDDYPDFVRALEAFRMAKGVAPVSTETESPELVIVHWPGNDTIACPDHLQKLVAVAATLGFRLSWTPTQEGNCANCANEKAKGVQP